MKYEKEYKVRLSPDEEKVIEFVSKKFASGKRIHELELLKRMLRYQNGLMKQLNQTLNQQYDTSLTLDQTDNIANIMTNEFPAGSGKKTYETCIFLEKDGDDYQRSKSFAQMLKNPEFYQILSELIEFGIHRYHRDYSIQPQSSL